MWLGGRLCCLRKGSAQYRRAGIVDFPITLEYTVRLTLFE